ncbi:hypothetical protein JW916_06820 [Candidatus Sumerlaeota bacterium]|nr:hypothetical protein [Candidatus Sumerlaeota bacterium]
MSPDPSVFEEQLREIEKSKRRRSFWRRQFGCGVFLFLVAAAIGAVWLWHNRARVFREGGDLERLGEQGRRIVRTPPDEILRTLRDEAAEIQERWEEFRRSGEDQKRLAELREKLVARREEAGGSAKKYWSDLVKQSDSLIAKAREKGEQVPEELEKLVGMMDRLEGAARRGKEFIETGLRSEDGTESSATLRPDLGRGEAASGDLDYGMDR